MSTSNPQGEITARLAKMTDDEIREILIDRDGWQAAMVEGAVQEAGKRGIGIGTGSQESVKRQAEKVELIIVQSIEGKVDLKGMIGKLTNGGLAEAEARATARKQVLEAAAPMLDACGRWLVIDQVICGLGVAATVASFFLAAPGGTYVVWWGAIVFGGLRAFFAASRKEYLEQLVAEAKSMGSESSPARD